MQSSNKTNNFICPSCNQPLQRDAEVCPFCGFHYQILIKRFGSIPKYDAYVTDVTEDTLSLATIAAIKRLLQRFEHRFPQVRLSVVVLALHENWDIIEYTFYLANRCNFLPPNRTGPNNNLLLMVIDVKLKQVALATGYGLERVLSAKELHEIIASAKKYLPGEKYKNFIRDVIARVTGKLLQKVREK